MQGSISRKLMYLYVVVAVTSISLIGLYAYYKAKIALMDRAIEQLDAVKSIKKVQLENLFHADSNQYSGAISTYVNQLLLDTTQIQGVGKSAEVYIVDNQFRLRSKSRFHRQPLIVNTLSTRTAFARGNGHLIANDYRNVLCLSSFDRLDLPGHPWAIIAEIDYAEAMAPITNLRNDLLLIALVILVLVFSIAQVITNDIIRPVSKMKQAALRISNGDYNMQVEAGRNDEFGLLGKAFNQMIAHIRQNTSDLISERTRRIKALFDGQEMERNRIAADLHDGLAQEMIAIRITLDNLVDRNELQSMEKIAQLRGQIIAATDEVRKISHDLAPAGLMESTLDMALANLVSQIRGKAHAEIELSIFGEFDQINQKAKIYLYRIAQEAIANALKHASARHINIQLTETPNQLVLIIEDDGQGFVFDPGVPGPGKGIFNMQERCTLINASFDVESLPGQGTTIRVRTNTNV